MRGSVRSTIIGEPEHVTPKMLGSDVAGIIKELNFGPASIYGCSSGGQAVLAIGKYYPEAARNLMVHEAALQSDTQIPNTGFEYFQNIAPFLPYCNGFAPFDVGMMCNYDKWHALGEDVLARIKENMIFWEKYYLGTVDLDTYSAEDLAKMPNLDFSVGTWTPSWMTYANIETAKRGNKSVTWLPSAHYPQVICPEELADYVRKTCRQYL
jgi:pimeloyl-ACP methyl ester carboxylesterase